MKNTTVIKTNETFLPLFSGFYGTNWEFEYYNIDDDIKNQRESKGLYSEYNIDDVKIDFESYENDVVKNFAEALQENLSEYNIVTKIEVQKIIHPKYYNFKNDSVDVIIEYNAEVLKDFIYSHRENFCKYLKSKYTSCDGFISHYSNDFETWETESHSFSDFSKNGHYLGSILDFICHELNITEFIFYETVMENIYTLNYAENLEDVINQSDNSLYEFLTKNGISRNYADYIETSYNNDFLASINLSEKILSVIREFEACKAEA